MSTRDGNTNRTKQTRVSRFEAVQEQSHPDTEEGVIPIPARFTDAGVISPTSRYAARLYYDSLTEAVGFYLLSSPEATDTAPFPNTSDALFTVERAPDEFKTPYFLRPPEPIQYGFPLSKTVLQWGVDNSTSVIYVDIEPSPDPVATCGPGLNTVGHIDDTTVFAVNGAFRDVADDALEEAGIIDRTTINTRETKDGAPIHTVTCPTNALPFNPGEEIAWRFRPSDTYGRLLLKPTFALDTPGYPVRVTGEAVECMIPRAVSNLAALPQPREVVWVNEGEGVTAII